MQLDNEHLNEERNIRRSKAIQAMKDMLDYLELEELCESKSAMKELLTTSDIMAEFKVSRTKAGQIMRVVGFSSGKMQRARRADVIAYWRDYGKNEASADSFATIK